MSALAPLAAHLHQMLAGRSAGTVWVFGRTLLAPDDHSFLIEGVEAEGGRLLLRLGNAPWDGPLVIDGPEEVVLDEEGLRIGSAARVEWGEELAAERLSRGWARLVEQGSERLVETGRRHALRLDPVPGSGSWTGLHQG
jgi:hypothetical protein